LLITYSDLSWFLSRTKFRQELKVLDDFVYPYVHRSLALTPDQLQFKLSSRDNLLDSLALHTRDAKFLRDQMITILLAGRDTTAVTLSFIFFELSRNPAVLEKLRKEIVDKIGEGDAATTPSVKDLKGMKTLNAVIDETFRLYPPVPLNFRCALRDTTLPRGGGKDGLQPIGILKGTKVLFSIMLVHTNPDLYPAINGKGYHDPNKWIPARWLDLDERKKSWTPGLWNFLPFHHGKRACPGQKFAQVEIAYTVARILQTYKAVRILGWDQPESMEKELECRVAVTMSPAEKLKYVFTR
jgi:cytochrome P450